MNLIKCLSLLLFCMATMSLSGCYLEQGKLHFEELNLNPISVYSMKPLETAIYCIADGNIPTGTELKDMHLQSLQQVESNPEEADWGELVCLSLSEQATIEQVKETKHAMVLVIAARKDLRGAARGFKKLIDQKIEILESFQNYETQIGSLEKDARDTAVTYDNKIQRITSEVVDRDEKIEILENQVRELKEVELLIQPTQNINDDETNNITR